MQRVNCKRSNKDYVQDELHNGARARLKIACRIVKNIGANCLYFFTLLYKG